MDASGILDKLPGDVLRVVLSHVPSPWVVQARVVCKQWREILSSTSFALQWALKSTLHPSPQSLCLLLLHHQKSRLSALHLPTLLSIPLSSPPSASLLPLASSPLGILFSSPSLSLFHPLSRHSFPIPAPPLIRYPIAAAFAPLRTGFHILLLGQSDNPANPPAAEIYNSVNSAWTTLPCLPTLYKRTRIPRSMQSLVWWRDTFCMLWGNHILTYKPPHTIKAAGEAQSHEVWGRINLPKYPRIWDARFLTLHVVKDRLCLEGNFQEQGNFQRKYPLRIGVLEFDPTSLQWKEMGFMPDTFSKRLCKQQQHPAHCFYTAYSDPHCHNIYFSTHMEEGEEGEAGIELVQFDVCSSTWTSISNVPGAAALFASPTFKGFTFHAIMDHHLR